MTLTQNQDKWKYNGPMNSSTISAIGGGISMQSSQQQSHQLPPNTIIKPPTLPQMLNPTLHQQMQNQDRSRQPTVSVSGAAAIDHFNGSFLVLFIQYVYTFDTH